MVIHADYRPIIPLPAAVVHKKSRQSGCLGGEKSGKTDGAGVREALMKSASADGEEFRLSRLIRRLLMRILEKKIRADLCSATRQIGISRTRHCRDGACSIRPRSGIRYSLNGINRVKYCKFQQFQYNRTWFQSGFAEVRSRAPFPTVACAINTGWSVKRAIILQNAGKGNGIS